MAATSIRAIVTKSINMLPAPQHRYLFASEHFGDSAIAIWKEECIRRCQKKVMGKAYETYLNWIRQENELAVFTLYAYADLAVPMRFNTIFDLGNPDNFHQEEFELTQSIWEAWLPGDVILSGHKHLCVFRFRGQVPPILHLLHAQQGKFCDSPVGQARFGFCNSQDFGAIAQEIKRVQWLKRMQGEQ